MLLNRTAAADLAVVRVAVVVVVVLLLLLLPRKTLTGTTRC